MTSCVCTFMNVTGRASNLYTVSSKADRGEVECRRLRSRKQAIMLYSRRFDNLLPTQHASLLFWLALAFAIAT